MAPFIAETIENGEKGERRLILCVGSYGVKLRNPLDEIPLSNVILFLASLPRGTATKFYISDRPQF